MSSNHLIYPMFALALLTGTILLLITLQRFIAIRKGILKPNYLEEEGAEKAPQNIVKLTHNLNNLFEFPILFYVVCCVIIATDRVDQLYVWFAWFYVFIRYVHSLIHTTYNYVPHRAMIHMVSDMVIIALWVRLFIASL